MPQFLVRILPGFEQDIKNIAIPQAARKIVQRAFQLSFDKAWKNVVTYDLEDTDFFDDLESGVISAIFGFTPSMQVKQIENFKQMFRKKSQTKLIRYSASSGIISEISITTGDIKRLKVRHRIRKGKGTITFNWLEILINGLQGDEIAAQIEDNIGVDEYVESDSIFRDDLPSGISEDFSRSGHAIMVTPESFIRGENEHFRLSKATLEILKSKYNFQFHIIPHPFLINDIVERLSINLERLIIKDFRNRLKNIPPIKIEKTPGLPGRGVF